MVPLSSPASANARHRVSASWLLRRFALNCQLTDRIAPICRAEPQDRESVASFCAMPNTSRPANPRLDAIKAQALFHGQNQSADAKQADHGHQSPPETLQYRRSFEGCPRSYPRPTAEQATPNIIDTTVSNGEAILAGSVMGRVRPLADGPPTLQQVGSCIVSKHAPIC
jgi:hypothetical protein